jgi:hypothetical protein
MAEREILQDAIRVRWIHDAALAEAPQALGIFGLGQVPAAGV